MGEVTPIKMKSIFLDGLQYRQKLASIPLTNRKNFNKYTRFGIPAFYDSADKAFGYILICEDDDFKKRFPQFSNK